MPPSSKKAVTGVGGGLGPPLPPRARRRGGRPSLHPSAAAPRPAAQATAAGEGNTASPRDLEHRLGVRFRGAALLELALTHRSVTNEAPDAVSMGDNERMEFLGDAVLGLVVGEQLYRAFPDATEGALTVMRAELVRGSNLAAWGRRFDLGGHLILGRGESRAGGRNRDAVLAACFEAVIGALYLDRGQRAVRALVQPLVAEALPTLSSSQQSADAKSELQRRVQAAAGRLPTYRVVGVEGPEHQPRFTVEVEALPGLVGRGVGSTKQAAEQQAARAVLSQVQDPAAEARATDGSA